MSDVVGQTREDCEQDFYDQFMEFQETRLCGNCGHFDTLNRGCWVVASDGIFRHREEGDYCVFDFKEEYS